MRPQHKDGGGWSEGLCWRFKKNKILGGIFNNCFFLSTL